MLVMEVRFFPKAPPSILGSWIHGTNTELNSTSRLADSDSIRQLSEREALLISVSHVSRRHVWTLSTFIG